MGKKGRGVVLQKEVEKKKRKTRKRTGGEGRDRSGRRMKNQLIWAKLEKFGVIVALLVLSIHRVCPE